MLISQDRPMATIILFAYNQEDLVVEAVESLLAQTYSPLEIILSDDCSSDNTFNRMRSLVDGYSGTHRIKLNRNKNNLGVVAHVNAAVALAEGELIFGAAGDDISLPERCEKVVAFWVESGKKSDLIATDAYDLAFDGQILGIKSTDKLENWTSVEDWFLRRPFIFGASFVWSRSLVDRFGPLNSYLKQEDQIITFRAILTGSAVCLPEPLVMHRRGGVSQKDHSLDFNEKCKAITSGNANGLAFIAQCIKDASVLGQGDLVGSRFNNQLSSHLMINDLFNAHSILQKCKIVFSAKNVRFDKRVRFLIYAGFPWIMKSFFWIKNIYKKA